MSLPPEPLPMDPSIKETSILLDVHQYRSFGPYSVPLPASTVDLSLLAPHTGSAASTTVDSSAHSSDPVGVADTERGRLTSGLLVHHDTPVHWSVLQYQPQCRLEHWPPFQAFPPTTAPHPPRFHPQAHSTPGTLAGPPQAREPSTGVPTSAVAPSPSFDPTAPLHGHGSFLLLLFPADQKRALVHFPHHFLHFARSHPQVSKHLMEIVLVAADATLVTLRIHLLESTLHVFAHAVPWPAFLTTAQPIVHVVPHPIPSDNDLLFLQTYDHQIVPVYVRVEWKTVNLNLHVAEITYQRSTLSLSWLPSLKNLWQGRKPILHAAVIHVRSKPYLAVLTPSEFTLYTTDADFSQTLAFPSPKAVHGFCAHASKLALYSLATVHLYNLHGAARSLHWLESVSLAPLERNNRFVDAAFVDAAHLVVLKATFSNYETYIHRVPSSTPGAAGCAAASEAPWARVASDMHLPAFAASRAYLKFAQQLPARPAGGAPTARVTHDELVAMLAKTHKKTREEAESDVALFLVKYAGHLHQAHHFLRLSESAPLMLAKNGGISLFRPPTDLERYVDMFHGLRSTPAFSAPLMTLYHAVATMFHGCTPQNLRPWLDMDQKEMHFSLEQAFAKLAPEHLAQLGQLKAQLLTTRNDDDIDNNNVTAMQQLTDEFVDLYQTFRFDETTTIAMKSDLQLVMPHLIGPILHQVLDRAQQLAHIVFLLFLCFQHWLPLAVRLTDLLRALRTFFVLPHLLQPPHLAQFPTHHAVPLTQLDEWVPMYLAKACAVVSGWTPTDLADNFFAHMSAEGRAACVAIAERPGDRLYLTALAETYAGRPVAARHTLRLAVLAAPEHVARVASHLELHGHPELALALFEMHPAPTAEHIERLVHLYLRTQRPAHALPLLAHTPRPDAALHTWAAGLDAAHAASLPRTAWTLRAVPHIPRLEVRAAFFLHHVRDPYAAAQCYHALPTTLLNLTRTLACLRLAHTHALVTLRGTLVHRRDLERAYDHHWMAALVHADPGIAFTCLWETCVRHGFLDEAHRVLEAYPEQFHGMQQQGRKALKSALVHRFQTCPA